MNFGGSFLCFFLKKKKGKTAFCKLENKPT